MDQKVSRASGLSEACVLTVAAKSWIFLNPAKNKSSEPVPL